MGLRREVHDHVRLLLFKQAEDELPVRDIPPDKAVIRRVLHRLHALQVPRVGQEIEVDDLILRMILHFILHKIASDKTGAAGSQSFSFYSSLIF